MNDTLTEQQAFHFSLPLPDSIHEAAEIKSQQYLPHTAKAENVYLNHLSQYALRYYLELHSYEVVEPIQTNRDFIHQAFLEGVGLKLAGYGVVECMPLAEDQTSFTIPVECQRNRIAYVAVQLDDDLAHAKILGFVARSQEHPIATADLSALSTFPAYLAQVNPLASSATILNRWWQKTFESGWDFVSELMLPERPPLNPAFGMRSLPTAPPPAIPRGSVLSRNDESMPEDGVVCHKHIKLNNYAESFSLRFQMDRFSGELESSIRLLIRLTPELGQSYLPDDVELSVADETGSVFSSMQAREFSESIEVRFRADPGDYFSLRVILDDVTLTEGFVV